MGARDAIELALPGLTVRYVGGRPSRPAVARVAHCLGPLLAQFPSARAWGAGTKDHGCLLPRGQRPSFVSPTNGRSWGWFPRGDLRPDAVRGLRAVRPVMNAGPSRGPA